MPVMKDLDTAWLRHVVLGDGPRSELLSNLAGLAGLPAPVKYEVDRIRQAAAEREAARGRAQARRNRKPVPAGSGSGSGLFGR